MYYAFVYYRINYGVEVYSSCSNKLMDKVQVVQNTLSKLLLRCHPRSSTNELHNDLSISKVYQISEISVIIFAVKCLQGDCPPCLKNYFKIRHNPYGTRQRGKLVYPRARIGCGFSRVQYRAADLWNKLGSNFQTEMNWKDPYVKILYLVTMIEFVSTYYTYVCLFISLLHFFIYLRRKAGMTLRKHSYANVSQCKSIHTRILVVVGLSLK